MYSGESLDSPQVREELARAGAGVWRGADGEFQGFFHQSPGAKARWIIFYGNGDHARRALGWGRVLAEILPDMPVDYYVMEYPGYGPREGTPSEESILAAAERALESLPEDGRPVYLFGQSLGAAVAVGLAGRRADQIDGLVLANPFDTMESAGRNVLRGMFGPLAGVFPVGWMLRDRYESVGHIRVFDGPVAVVTIEQDHLTPAWMARRLVAAAPGPVRLWVQPHSGHWVDMRPSPEAAEFLRFVIGPDVVPEVEPEVEPGG